MIFSRYRHSLIFHTRLLFCTATQHLNINDSKIMTKIMTKGNKKKGKWFAPTQIKDTGLTVGNEAVKKTRNRNSEETFTRQVWMNSVLLEAILGILNSGEFDIHFHVVKVEMVHDFSALKVFWKASGNTEQDSALQVTLDQKAGRLRHLLIESRVCGRVPPVCFIKDLSLARLKQVEDLFKNLDTGPSHREPDLSNVQGPAGLGDHDNMSSLLNARGKLGNLDIDFLISQSAAVRPLHGGNTDESNRVCDMQSFDSQNIVMDSEKASISVGLSGSGKVFKVSEKSNINVNAKHSIDKFEIEDLSVPIRQDMYGLQHDVLMQKVLDAKSSVRRQPYMEAKESGDEGDLLKFKRDKNKAYTVKKISKRKLERMSRKGIDEEY
ncbi:uncharacterized protein LOC127857540 isoform X1 [Dreissena polymorpha]|nr:uncharacterized protein LOC127857540 isoform X1 [Dreissena polymorpha]